MNDYYGTIDQTPVDTDLLPGAEEFSEFLYENAGQDYTEIEALVDKALAEGLVTGRRIFLAMLTHWVETVASPKNYNYKYEVFVTDAESTYRGTTIEIKGAYQKSLRAIRVYRRTSNG